MTPETGINIIPALDAHALVIMSTHTAGPTRQRITDEATHNDGATDKSWTTHAAEAIDASVWFHAFYGALDGLSVSYSTVKFLCEVYSRTGKDYRENLKFVLSDLDFWVPLIGLGTIVISVASLLGNGISKKDGKDVKSHEKLIKKTWSYTRDILKGCKNGYKGIKTLSYFLSSLGVLDDKNLRSVVLPIGLIFGISAIINRVYLRQVRDELKNINKAHDKVFEKIKVYNKLLQDIQLLHTRILSAQANLVETPLDFNLRAQLQAYQQQLEEMTAEVETVDVEALLKEQDEVRLKQERFNEYYKYRMLVSKGLGGIIDGPYLYVGMTSLAVLSTTALMAMSGVIAFFLVACIVVRINEGVEELRQNKINLVKQNIEKAIHDAVQLQHTISKQNAARFIKFKESNPTLKDHTLLETFHQYIAEENKHEEEALQAAYKKIDDELKKYKSLARPSEYKAALKGLYDGLSMFGALSSAYFGLSIVLTLSGISFPPFLIIGGAIFGLLAIAGAIKARLDYVPEEQKEFDTNFGAWKEKVDNELRDKDHKFKHMLDPIDLNTDGKTKGEFYFQSISEVVRCIFNGPYKSQNLTDFFTGPITISSAATAILWGSITVVYGLCLSLRAFGSGFKGAANSAKAEKHESSEPSEKPKKVFGTSQQHTLFATRATQPSQSPAFTPPTASFFAA